MNANHLVGVWVLENDEGKGGDEPFATGYPIAPNRILTVAHVFKPNASKIIVWFVYCDAKPVVAKVVWNGREKDPNGLDAMVLECPFPPTVMPSVELMTEAPRDVLHWHSNCFPQFARTDKIEKGRYLDALGSINPVADVLTSFPIDCNEKNPVSAAWGGASGGPIFVGKSRLVGILSGVRLGAESNEDGKPVAPFQRLIAVPAWKLAADPDFIASLGGVSSKDLENAEQEWKKRVAARIRMDLGGINDEFVSERFEIEFGIPLLGERRNLETISGTLVDDPTLVHVISDIRENCRKKQLQDSAERLEQVENQMLPRLFPPEQRKRFWDELRFRGAILVENATTSQAGADLWMSIIDKRGIELRSDKPTDVVTRWTAPAMLRLGVIKPGDLSGECLAFRILLEMAEQRLPPEYLTVTEEACRQILTGVASEPTRESALKDAEELAARLDKWLDAKRRQHGTPYCVIRVSDTGLPRQTLKEALAVLRDWNLRLDFLEISNNSPHGRHEAPMLSLLSSR